MPKRSCDYSYVREIDELASGDDGIYCSALFESINYGKGKWSTYHLKSSNRSSRQNRPDILIGIAFVYYR